jgi:error-prone DNA polymerase
VRQRPGEGNVIFCTIEDETGIANVVIWTSLLERFRREALGSSILLVHGRIQRTEENIVHLIADRLEERNALISLLEEDEFGKCPRQRTVLRSRDFR